LVAQRSGGAAFNRLRVEMLRAHMPQRFKTPGSGQQAPLIAGDNNQVMIMTGGAAGRADSAAAGSVGSDESAAAHGYGFK
jgi:hypothetical protein